MKQYHELLENILENGITKEDRTGTGTISLFGTQLKFKLSDGFPLMTTKKVPFNSVLSELLWFLEGSTDERRLAEIHYELPREELINKKTIWTANADKQGKDLGYINTETTKELGPVYGSQWRRYTNFRLGARDVELRNMRPVDQIKNVIESIKSNPDSRRHLVSAWNVCELDKMALPPCHYAFQFYVNDGKLSVMFQMRSCDVFLGLPFNIASYALLLMMIAQVTGLEPDEVIFTGGDTHIYLNHLVQVKELLSRDYNKFKLPEVVLNPGVTNIDDFTMDDFILSGYESYRAISAPMAV
jgi:thymidylate synthase